MAECIGPREVRWAANTGYIVGDNGVIMVDAFEFGSTVRDVLGELAKITPNEVTPFHFQSLQSRSLQGDLRLSEGLDIICQENTAVSIESILHYVRDAERVHFEPTHTVDKRVDLKIHGVNIRLLHWAPAHTDGDLVTYLPDHKIAFIGDLGSGTGVHLEDRGSTEGAIETLKQIAALDADITFGGHGDPITKAQVQENLANAKEKRAKIVQLFEAGKSLAEAEVEMGMFWSHHLLPRAVSRCDKCLPASSRKSPAEDLPRISGDELYRDVYTELARATR